MPAYSGTRTMTHFVFSKFNGTRSLDYYVAANRAVYEELEDYMMKNTEIMKPLTWRAGCTGDSERGCRGICGHL